MTFRRLNTPSPTHCVADGDAMSNFGNLLATVEILRGLLDKVDDDGVGNIIGTEDV